MGKQAACPSKVLVVDDNEANRYAVSKILEKGGFSVFSGGTGAEALGLAKEHRPDVVILDVCLPDANGIDVCRKIKADPETSFSIVVHLSAHFVTAKDKAYGLEEGADGYLTHPIEPSVLIATINSYVRLRKVEADLKRAIDERDAVIEKLEVERELRERFVSTLTHDLRNPLTAAKMNAQVLLRRLHEEKLRPQLLTRILGALGRADSMIQDLLDANRIRAGQELAIHREECELRGIVSDVLVDAIAAHGERFELKRGEPLRGRWDPDSLRRVVENLLSNAVKYGEVEGPIEVELSAKSNGVELSVHNKGKPIPVETQSDLFQAFRRGPTNETRGQKGWGLGLTLVRGIAEAHGGSVRVESSAERGTTFTVSLPHAAENHACA